MRNTSNGSISSARSKPTSAARSVCCSTCKVRSCAWARSRMERGSGPKARAFDQLHRTIRERAHAQLRTLQVEQHTEIFAALKPGAELLLDDGRLRLKVEKSGQ